MNNLLELIAYILMGLIITLLKVIGGMVIGVIIAVAIVSIIIYPKLSLLWVILCFLILIFTHGGSK